MVTYFTNFWKQPSRGVLLKSNPEKLRKIHKKASFVEFFCSSVKLLAYKVPGAIKGTSQSKLYSKLGFESLKFKYWFRKLCTFLKIKTTGKAGYLFDIIRKNNHSYNTPLSRDVTAFYSRTDIFKYSFSPSTILKWNKLDRRIQQSTIMLSFRNALLKIG